MVNNVGDEISTDGFIWRWSSSDPSVIEIDETGMAVAKEDGTAVITARAASITGSVSVLVRQIPAGLAVVGGDEQTGVVAAALAVPISVKLVDAGGFVMLDQSVEFGVTSGGGSIPAGTVATDADGVATTNWTLGTKATDEQKLTATSANKSAVFTATALPDVPTSLVPTGQAQNGFAMEALDTTIAISVFDQHGNPVPDHGVTWQVLTGDGSITASSDKTDASGNATATWTLGTPIGNQSAQADAAALGLTTFTATAGPNVIITGNVSVRERKSEHSGRDQLAAPRRRPSDYERAAGIRSGRVDRDLRALGPGRSPARRCRLSLPGRGDQRRPIARGVHRGDERASVVLGDGDFPGDSLGTDQG